MFVGFVLGSMLGAVSVLVCVCAARATSIDVRWLEETIGRELREALRQTVDRIEIKVHVHDDDIKHGRLTGWGDSDGEEEDGA